MSLQLVPNCITFATWATLMNAIIARWPEMVDTDVLRGTPPPEVYIDSIDEYKFHTMVAAIRHAPGLAEQLIEHLNRVIPEKFGEFGVDKYWYVFDDHFCIKAPD